MTRGTDNEPLGFPVRPCPICGKPNVLEHRPFCSRHCADVDLHRWLSGRYVVPAGPDPEDEGDAEEGPGQGS